MLNVLWLVAELSLRVWGLRLKNDVTAVLQPVRFQLAVGCCLIVFISLLIKEITVLYELQIASVTQEASAPCGASCPHTLPDTPSPDGRL